MNENIVQFEIISKKDEEIYLEGYVDINEIDDDEPLIFYDHTGYNESYHVPNNPYSLDSEDWMEYEKITSEFSSDDLFLQFLHDYANENKRIDRGEYILDINEGDCIEE